MSDAAHEEHDYLVWSNEHRAWWAPGAHGYVRELSRAGRYTRTGALEICRRALGTAGHLGMLAELPVRVVDVKVFLHDALVPSGLL